MPKLAADGVYIPREIRNDCDPGDRYDINNATVEERKSRLGRDGKIHALTFFYR